MMPQAPIIPESPVGAAPASPANYLMAAADLHSSNALDPQRSMPQPTGRALQTGKPITRPKHIKVVR